jgi:hypothetical protein
MMQALHRAGPGRYRFGDFRVTHQTTYRQGEPTDEFGWSSWELAGPMGTIRTFAAARELREFLFRHWPDGAFIHRPELLLQRRPEVPPERRNGRGRPPKIRPSVRKSSIADNTR